MKSITYDETKWKLVPVVVTPEISAVYGNDSGAYQSAQELHTAMLAAAPEAPQPSQQAVEKHTEAYWRHEINMALAEGYERGRKSTQPIQSEDARDAAYAAFDSWWDGVEQIETPETYLGWRESCRKAWYAGVASAMSKHGATPDEPVCCVADLNENVRSQMLVDGYLLSDGLFAAMQEQPK